MRSLAEVDVGEGDTNVLTQRSRVSLLAVGLVGDDHILHCVVRTGDGDRDVAADGGARIVLQGDRIDGRYGLTGGEVLRERVIEGEGPVDRAIIRGPRVQLGSEG